MSADEGLRAWARGVYTSEAAVELLIRAFGGRFARPTQPWIKETDGMTWVDAEALATHVGPLSGGERRVLAVAAALLDSRHPVALTDALPGLDREHLDLVLAAVAHGAGSHESSTLEEVEGTASMRLVRLPTLYPWPATEA